MNLMEAIEQRHSVRRFLEKPLDSNVVKKLTQEIDKCNEISGLHIQLLQNEPKAVGSWFIHYGRFTNVKNYIALIGTEDKLTCEKCGYYGEKIVLLTQQLGLNTCWISGSFKPVNEAVSLNHHEKILLIIAIGYGKDQGKSSKSKPISEVSEINSTPDWFMNGVKAALLAPTAMNKQNFYFKFQDNQVSCQVGHDLRDQIDLGILKYHFEIGAGNKDFTWIS